MAKIVLSIGGAIVQQRFVDKETIAIGGHADNGLVIDDPAVEPKHAAILCVGNDHILEDLGSSAGTLVNGTRVTRHILQHGDVVQLGSFYLRYVNPRAADADFERTMLISGMPGLGDAAGPAAAKTPAARSRVRFPSGRARMTAGPRAGQTVALDRVIAVFGSSGRGRAVVTRRPHGYSVTHVEGRRHPRVNGAPIGTRPRALAHGDRVEAGDEAFDFMLD
ncbi:MAG TPA: FHA domain-containing protein [Casimicrobiaceae bacterium]|jgi:pSer/pThr/pTyr-binding forkhead associated (FHA) protein|nr:FHA domain-containing protein [Casimicrobiaceae bacterium]